MSERRRLVLAAALCVGAIGAGVVWSHRITARRVADAVIADDVRDRVTTSRARCEASPEAWSASERPAEASTLGLFAYDARLGPSAPGSPPIAAPLAAAVKRGRPHARRTLREGNLVVHEQLVRLPWSEGPCAFVLSRRRAPSLSAERPPLVPALFTLLAPLLIAMIARSPRLRRESH